MWCLPLEPKAVSIFDHSLLSDSRSSVNQSSSFGNNEQFSNDETKLSGDSLDSSQNSLCDDPCT